MNNNKTHETTQQIRATRRQVLTSLGAAGAGLVAGSFLGNPFTPTLLGQAAVEPANANTGMNTLIHNVKDYGAAGDGTTDDTAAIASAIDACRAKQGGIVYFPAGIYLTGTQVLGSNMQVIGAGSGVSRLKLKADVNDSVLQGVLAENIRISHLTIDGNAKEQNTGSTLLFYKCKKIWIEHISVINSSVLGLNMSEVIDSCITDCYLTGTLESAVVWFGSTDAEYSAGNNRIVNCIMEDGALDGIIYNTNRGIIANNIIRNNGKSVKDTAGGIYINGTHGTVIVGNIIEGNDGNGIDIINATELLVDSNMCRDNNCAGIMFDTVTNSTISGNICGNNGKKPVTDQDDGISMLGECKDVVIANNVCFDTQTKKTQHYGIQSVRNCDHLLITGNILKGNAMGNLRLVGNNNLEANNMM